MEEAIGDASERLTCSWVAVGMPVTRRTVTVVQNGLLISRVMIGM